MTISSCAIAAVPISGLIAGGDEIKVAASLTSEYGPLLAVATLSSPYGIAPISAQHDQPIFFTVSASLTSAWSLQGVVHGQCSMPWGFTTPIAAQCLFGWDLLERDPVAASLTQFWDLSSDQAIRLSGVAVRAFHMGELV